MEVVYRKYSPRFHISRYTADHRIDGYWSMFGDAREEPDLINHFDQWFEWCRAKHEGRIHYNGDVWKGAA